MAEYIEREAALNADFKISFKRLDTRIKTARDAVQTYANHIAALPAADVKTVVRGEWIYDCERTMGDGWTYRQYHCSVCEGQMIGGIHNYCPNCGADMRGENNG